jgi:hypothetical protein
MSASILSMSRFTITLSDVSFYFRDDDVGLMALKRSLSRASHNGCLVEVCFTFAMMMSDGWL